MNTKQLRAELRIYIFISSIIGTVGCFCLSANGLVAVVDQWQSGELHQYVALLLTYPSVWPFVPLLVFNHLCLCCWLFSPSTQSNAVVRFGIFSGILISLQFLVLCTLAFGTFTYFLSFFAAPLTVFAAIILAFAWRKWRRFSIAGLLILTTIVAIGLGAILRDGKADYDDFAVPSVLVILFPSAPFLNFVNYLIAVLLLNRQQAGSTKMWIWLTGWLVYFGSLGAAWRLAVLLMLEEYSKLPTTAPDCFVSSAAAHGHMKFVGSREIRCTGKSIKVNEQMQWLKFLEFVLKGLSPGLHGSTRRIYNQLGPPLARSLAAHPLMADFAYTMLKPFELLARLAAIVFRIRSSLIKTIYTAT